MVDYMELNAKKPVALISNLSFDHPLSANELFELQNLLSSPILLSQIYFKDNIDVETIEKVKLLLEALPFVNDENIEKYIMKDVSDIEKEKLLNLNFFNINTWNISYKAKENRFSMTTFVKYKKMDEWYKKVFHELDINDFSILDKICYLYDKVKLFEFDNDSKYDRIPEIICDGKANAHGYNVIFKELLNKIGISSIIGKISNNEEDNYVTLAIINDEKNGINGIYVFDPSMDTIYKDQYKNNLARKMNYNFFAITVEKLKEAYPKRNMQEILKLLASDDKMEFNHFYDLYSSENGFSLDEELEEEFGFSASRIFDLIKNTKDISHDTIITVITKTLERYPDDKFNKRLLTHAISSNYRVRNSEIFTNEYVKKMSKVDTIY